MKTEGVYNTVRGYARLKVTGVEPSVFLDAALSEDLDLWGAVPEDRFSLLVTVRLRELDRASMLAERCFCQTEVLTKRGGAAEVRKVKRRLALVISAIGLLVLLTASSLFVWRIDVAGNESVSTVRIMNALEDNGVYIGSYWPSFNSELIRSHVIEEIPELKWLSVSLFGSRVYVEVREAEPAPELFDEGKACRVVAAKAGLIDELSVLRGVGAVKKGDTVAEGDLLIDGYIQSPFAGTRAVHAAGSAKARTWYELTAILPMEYTEKVYTGDVKRCCSLKIGHSRINFYGNSGIWGEKCDKITREKSLGVEGVFTLPVSLVYMSMEEYELQTAVMDEDIARERLEQVLNRELIDSLGEDGEVTEVKFSFSVTDGFGVGTLRAECLEDIAKEENLMPDSAG